MISNLLDRQTHLKTIKDTQEILREAADTDMSEADRAFLNRLVSLVGYGLRGRDS